MLLLALATLPATAVAQSAQAPSHCFDLSRIVDLAVTKERFVSCLGVGWAEAAEQSSPSYAVLHNAARPVSLTLSTDQTDSKRHVVRLTVFMRRN